MEIDLLNRWLVALRSGNYRQCFRRLVGDQGELCALGVLIDIADAWVHQRPIITYITEPTRRFLGITKNYCSRIEELNDIRQLTLAEIADVIQMDNEKEIGLDVWNKWIDALRSGRYQKGRYTLRQIGPGGYDYLHCPNGVLLEVAELWPHQAYFGVNRTNHYFLTDRTINALHQLGIPWEILREVERMNDKGGKSFIEVADYLEATQCFQDLKGKR